MAYGIFPGVTEKLASAKGSLSLRGSAKVSGRSIDCLDGEFVTVPCWRIEAGMSVHWSSRKSTRRFPMGLFLSEIRCVLEDKTIRIPLRRRHGEVVCLRSSRHPLDKLTYVWWQKETATIISKIVRGVPTAQLELCCVPFCFESWWRSISASGPVSVVEIWGVEIACLHSLSSEHLLKLHVRTFSNNFPGPRLRMYDVQTIRKLYFRGFCHFDFGSDAAIK